MHAHSFLSASGTLGLRSAAMICALSVAFLAGCTPRELPPFAYPGPTGTIRPVPRPANIEQTALRQSRAERARDANQQATAARSPASQTISLYLQAVENSLRNRGLMREEREPADAPFTDTQLTENFVRIALYDEYARQGEDLIADSRPSYLRRWTQPVRMQVEFGASVSSAERTRDIDNIANYVAQLQQASRHPVSLTQSGGNFTVLILSEDERHAIEPRLSELVPGIPASDLHAIRDLAPQNYCTVFAYSRGNSPEYVAAVALIRAEAPPRLRLSCIHEELAQGMGLANDSPLARPSIFNDNEEFALLTRHDELLLRILYDPRLRPGMTEAEARPIVRQIAAELLGDE